MERWAYIGDRFVEGSAAALSPFDLGLVRGFAVTDYLRTYGGEPFMLSDHFARFRRSAKGVGLEGLKSDGDLEEIVRELIRLVGGEVSVKLFLTGGISSDQFHLEGAPTFFALAYPFVPYPEEYFRSGVKVALQKYCRPMAQVKSTHYLPAVVAAQEAGTVDVLFHSPEGEVLEAGTANFFGIKDGVLITPKEGILKGITRQVVLDLAGQAEERSIHLSELPTLDGAFLTSSNKEVMPLSQIGPHSLPIPPELRSLMEAFSAISDFSQIR